MKDAQAEVDGCGIERIRGLLQLRGKAVVDIEISGDLNETEREILVDSPVSRFVGIGQCALGDIASDAQVIEFCLVGAQTGFDVAQALAVSQLREGQAEELIEM